MLQKDFTKSYMFTQSILSTSCDYNVGSSDDVVDIKTLDGKDGGGGHVDNGVESMD